MPVPGRRGALLLSLLAISCGDTEADPRPIRRFTEPAPVLSSSAAPVGPAPAACPAGMVKVAGFCVDRHEAHLVVRAGRAVHPHQERPEEGVIYEARSEAGVFPQAYINRSEAESACVNAGKRLCSRAEWQRACRGSRGHTYPHGDRREPGRCNTDKPHLITLRFGPYPSRWTYQHFNDPALDLTPGFLARTGQHAACVSDEGVHDMVGNLHEWVSDTADRALVQGLAADGAARAYQPWSPGNGVFMGGFFSTREEHGPGCLFTTVAHEARYHDYSTGFRCCADADP